MHYLIILHINLPVCTAHPHEIMFGFAGLSPVKSKISIIRKALMNRSAGPLVPNPEVAKI